MSADGARARYSTAVSAALLVLAATAVRASACDENSLSRRAGEIATLRHALAAQAIDDPTVVTPAVGRDLEALKDQLQALVAERVACAAADPRKASDDVRALLQERVPEQLDSGPSAPLMADERVSAYARRIDFRVVAEVGARPRITVITEIGIQCGRDSLLAVFEPDGDGWRERLRWRAPPYGSIADAHGDLQVRLSPVAADGRWHAAATVIAPWCSSAWSTLHYVVLRPGVNPDAPEPLLERRHPIWQDPDDDAPIVTADGVEFRFRAGSIDPGVHNRAFIHRYQFEGERLVRVRPVAESMRDFVDEWIIAERDEALAWTRSEARERLRSLKADFDAARGETLEFGPVARCRHSQELIAVNRIDRAETWYFRVGRTMEGDTLLDAGRRRDPDCVDLPPEPLSP